MPLIRDIIFSSHRLLIWNISESESELYARASLSSSSRNFYTTLQSHRRRKEWLAVRAMLHEVFPQERMIIDYASSGAPYLVDNNGFISISHTEGYAAVLLSSTRCGVDIECPNRDFSRVSNRFLSPDEQTCFSPEQYGLLWCAKEALFKVSGVTGVDFQRDIKILEIREQGMTAFFHRIYHLNYIMEKDWMVVFTI